MAAVKSFSTATGNEEPIVAEIVDDADDESCAEESAIVEEIIVEEAICANNSVGETENNVAANVKCCADETANVDEAGDESAVLEHPIGIANDGLVDDNVPLAPPLLHGSCTDHGSI